MSQTWNQRKHRLKQLLQQPVQNETGSSEDEFDQEDADGMALDRLLHGHNIIGPTARTKEIEALKFGDNDLNALGTLEQGQFGVIDVVSYRHSKGRNKTLYVRKTISKAFALRTRHQNSPSTERLLLLLAHRTNTPWVPHLIAAFHTTTHLSLVIPYAPLGSLWELFSSSPLFPVRIREEELKWWIPQVICAIAWCHEQGYAHRDVKPHNFVVTEDKRLMILDFGSAAPVDRIGEGGRRMLSKEQCQVPVGTCDYVSPEILKAHEAALVRLELEEEGEDNSSRYSSRNGSIRGSLRRMPSMASLVRREDEIYGIETDWWSMGAMLYELAYGVAPFFADDIGRTYVKIMDFKRSLRFGPDMDEEVSAELRDLLRRVLTDAEFRIGTRRGLEEFKEHRWLKGLDWDNLHQASPPDVLHLPQFIYSDQNQDTSFGDGDVDDLSKAQSSHSQGFAFSAFFQSSYTTVPTRASFSASEQPADPEDVEADENPAGVTPFQDRKQTMAWSSPGLSVLHSRSRSISSNDNPATAWIGFSWGPRMDAFTIETANGSPTAMSMATPKPRRNSRMFLSPADMSEAPMATPMSDAKRYHGTPFRTPAPVSTPGTFRTPFRTPYQTQTLPAFGHGGGNGGFYTPNPRLATPGPGGIATVTGTARRRPLSDRQAMAKLVDCVGMSARKRVEESGRKCRILNAGTTPASIGVGRGAGTAKTGFDLKRFASGVDFTSSLAGEGSVQGDRERVGPMTGSKKSTSGKKLRFAVEDDGTGKPDKSDYADYSSLAFSDVNTPRAASRGRSAERSLEEDTEGELFFQSSPSQSRSQISRQSRSRSLSQSFSLEQTESGQETEGDTDLETTTTTSVPPSPSPSPRPGSAASGTLLSGFGGMSGGGWGGYGRSGTPTLTLTFFGKNGRERPPAASTTMRSSRSQSQPDETVTTTTSEALRRSLSSTASYTSVLDAPLDEMGEKHARMMREITRLEERLRSIREDQ
ncbi:hypothetical protein AAF712_001561 [Marasmius tenuissimus]|uniref:Protein kinase domain-containing protein n=1 Tax=Marasmius tenuissimus TaxID=585030 RepID=A0ABR3ABR1_9AGAR